MSIISNNRNFKTRWTSCPMLIAGLSAFAIGSTAQAATTQVGDLRLPSNTYSGAFTYFDPASPTHTTRAVAGAPVGINSDFIAVTQNSGGGSPDSATDIGLRTYSSETTIRTINRYASDQDGPGGASGTQTAGAVQWSIDLTPLDGYLSGNSLNLTALDLRLVVNKSDELKEYDVYLSYTNPAESISLAGLSTGATAGDDNYDNFWWPAQSTAEGSVANGTHKVLELDFVGDMDLTVDLLSLYQAGVKDFNLIMASGAFYSGRTTGILDGSGISIDTAPIPEPSSLALLGLGGLLVARRRR